MEMEVSYNINLYIKEGKARLVLDHVAFAVSRPVELLPLEYYYFTRNGKSKYGNYAEKRRVLETLERIYQDWAVAVTKATGDEYSDF